MKDVFNRNEFNIHTNVYSSSTRFPLYLAPLCLATLSFKRPLFVLYFITERLTSMPPRWNSSNGNYYSRNIGLEISNKCLCGKKKRISRHLIFSSTHVICVREYSRANSVRV